MSIQTREYTSRKTGKTTTKYYAVVFDAKQKKAIWLKQSYKTEREAKREEARMLRDPGGEYKSIRQGNLSRGCQVMDR